jgi:aryl-alcohol dehydrogenase-like predicted oxidoreductase
MESWLVKATIAGKPLSALGLGCATFGREIDETAAFAIMDEALSRGLMLFDTAAAYGNGSSERIVGVWLASRRPADVILATKLLPPYNPAKLEEDLEQSLERLGVASVDLLYLHQWHPGVENLETLAVLDGWVRRGHVRALGASNFRVSQLARALSDQQGVGLARFEVIQNNHNFAVSDLDLAMLELCAAEELAVITYSPLGAGFLTGKHRGGVVEGSRFAIAPGHQAIYFRPEAWRRLEKLETVAGRHGLAPAHVALAWAMHSRPTHCMLVGGRSTAQLEQALAASALDDPALFEELESP